MFIRDRHPRQRTTRRVLLLAQPAPDPFTGFGCDFLLPGGSSQEGGIEEFPAFRPTIRSNAVTRSTSRAFAAVSPLIAFAGAATSTPSANT